MQDTWTSLRVRKRTADRVRAELRAMMLAHYTGGYRLPEDQCDGPTPDWLLNHLLDVVAKHRERAKAAKAKAARERHSAKKAAEAPPEGA